ncbi:16118_t:CDS:1, partial [Funneliformis caledonium]
KYYQDDHFPIWVVIGNDQDDHFPIWVVIENDQDDHFPILGRNRK